MKNTLERTLNLEEHLDNYLSANLVDISEAIGVDYQDTFERDAKEILELRAIARRVSRKILAQRLDKSS